MAGVGSQRAASADEPSAHQSQTEDFRHAPSMDQLQANQVCTALQLAVLPNQQMLVNTFCVATDWYEVSREFSAGCKRLPNLQ